MFNWVHSKFHYNPLKDRNASRKNTESMTKEAKTQGLAKQGDEMVDILDDWRLINGRRLTIFLMGFERSSKPRNYKAQYFNFKEELGKKDEIIDNIVDVDDDDDMSPLMATTFLNNFDHNGEFCTQFEKSQVVVAIERHVAQRLRRRVTLADLLMADSDGSNLKPAVLEKVAASDLLEKLPEVKTAGGSCFAKKVKVAAEPPARNLRRVMRKMTKRKVHAEVDHQQLLGQKILINHHNLYGKHFEPSCLPPIQATSA